MSSNISNYNNQPLENKMEILENEEIEQPSFIKSPFHNKKNIVISIIVGALVIGTIAALALGLIFGPLAALGGFCGGAIIGGLLGYVFTIIHRKCFPDPDSENQIDKNIRRTRELLNELAIDLNIVKVNPIRTTSENIRETRRLLNQLSLDLNE